MTNSTDDAHRKPWLPAGCLDYEGLIVRAGWPSVKTARMMNSRANKRREAGTPHPGDLPAPDGYAGQRPYWREEAITAWLTSRPSAVRRQNEVGPGLKRCSKCREAKPETEFHTYQARGETRLMAKCKTCHQAVAEDWNRRNPERRRELRAAYGKRNRRRNRARQYGLTVEELDAMEAAQGGRCLICREPAEKLAIDHCHTTGKVRGLLCTPCNKGLGHFRDQPARLIAAALYLGGTVAA